MFVIKAWCYHHPDTDNMDVRCLTPIYTRTFGVNRNSHQLCRPRIDRTSRVYGHIDVKLVRIDLGDERVSSVSDCHKCRVVLCLI